MDPLKMQNLGYLFWAYSLFWLLLAGYLVILTGRLRRARKDLEALQASRQQRPDTSA